jgi:hypothetical protein
MITISGLTPKQKALMTVMWDIDSVDKVQEFIRTLPAADARDAHCSTADGHMGINRTRWRTRCVQ